MDYRRDCTDPARDKLPKLKRFPTFVSTLPAQSSPQTALATYFLRRKNAPAASKTPTAAISGNDEPDDDDELAAAAGFIVAPPLSSPTTRPPRISRASSECPISSNGSVASVPAQSRITSSPPGCSSKYDPQSYTFPL